MANIQFLDIDGLNVLLTELRKRMSTVYEVKGNAIYADEDYLKSSHPAAINSIGLWAYDNGTYKIVTNPNIGWVYNITNGFTTDNNFVEGAGNKLLAGINIVAINIGTEETPNIKWDLLATSLNLDAYQTKLLSSAIRVFDKEVTYANVDSLPTSPSNVSNQDIAVLTDSNVKGDVYRATVENSTVTWEYLGNNSTVEGMLKLLVSISQPLFVEDSEIIALFNE